MVFEIIEECSTCVFWKCLETGEFGICENLIHNSDYIQIELDTGNNGGWVNTIKTYRNFYCNLYN